jgi:hypothetical protein
VGPESVRDPSGTHGTACFRIPSDTEVDLPRPEPDGHEGADGVIIKIKFTLAALGWSSA